jgi:hypothetical protein
MKLKLINSEKMYDEHCKKKKMFMGFVLLVFGIVWYMRDTGAIILEPFWPIIVILASLLIIVKALVMCPETKRRR